MKIISFIKSVLLTALILFTFNMTSVTAQSSEEEIAKEPYRSDAIIRMIIYYLPSGWTFSESNGYFIIQKTDSIWVLEEDPLSNPSEKKEEKNKRIQVTGKKTVANIIIKYEKKWEFIRVQEVSLNNLSVTNEIKALPEKYKISHLKDMKLSTKNKIVYSPVTQEDVKLIEDYYAEKKRLEAKLIISPDYSTQQFSLFIVSKTGCIDKNHLVYPESASMECYTILALIREVCGK